MRDNRKASSDGCLSVLLTNAAMTNAEASFPAYVSQVPVVPDVAFAIHIHHYSHVAA